MGLKWGSLIAIGLMVFAILQPALAAGALLISKKYKLGMVFLIWASILLVVVVMFAYLVGFWVGSAYTGPLYFI
ncbi:MAG: hypothetical protein Q8P76_01765 [bacterium]|nr:hypothetical protein [bacterium]